MTRPNPAFPGSAGRPGMDAALLRFVADMYGVQLDQLAALLTNWGQPAASAADLAREIVADWRATGHADTGQLSLGEPWVWATRKGLDACGHRTKLIRPAPATLRHTHAVTEVRLALGRTSSWRQSRAQWRSERSILAGAFPSRVGHVPDGEVHYPTGTGMPWAGEIWAVEVELSRKSVEHTAAIMQEIMARTSDYGGPPAGHAVPGLPPRYARLVYVCSPVSVRSVLNAQAEVGPPHSARIDVHDLPESALRLNPQKRGWEP